MNRPLRQRDDDVIQSTKQLLYRDQINKVANAIDEIMRGLRKGGKIHPGEKETGHQSLIETKNREKTKSGTIKPVKKRNFHQRLAFVPWLVTITGMPAWYHELTRSRSHSHS